MVVAKHMDHRNVKVMIEVGIIHQQMIEIDTLNTKIGNFFPNIIKSANELKWVVWWKLCD